MGSDQNIWEKAIPGEERFSLVEIVNGKNLQKKNVQRHQFGDEGESCHNPDGVTCVRPHKSY
jgi:hypothetical protein